MYTAGEQTSRGPAAALFAGFLLLAFAGALVVLPSSSRPASTGVHGFLPRRMQLGYITTSKMPSSLDSSDSSGPFGSGSFLEPSKSFESGSLESSEYRALTSVFSKSIGGYMGWLTFWLLVQLIFAILYSKKVVRPIDDTWQKLDESPPNASFNNGFNEFNNGFFECYKDKWVCVQGLCCPMVRVSHTNAASGVCSFWESMLCYCCCAWSTLNIGPFCLLMLWRLRLKNIMGLEASAINDFCLTILCPCVSICQMSSAVDNAIGYQTTGCCEYTPYAGSGYGTGYDGQMDQF